MTGLKIQTEQVRVYQEYESLALVVSQALGGKTSRSVPDDVVEPQTYDELAKLAAMMGGKVG
jgi:hypothetical protein